ncbi:MAG: T9SS type A sorting domain-containing protein [Crocinitomicaceae bacterium]|nr:T9SS type A sorting domain-containing protein [Crocinitomicaceae bacterium]
MKRNLLSLFAVVAGVSATFAQPTFNSTDEAAIGNHNYYVADTAGFDMKTSTNGANATWDWSTLMESTVITPRTANVNDATSDMTFQPLGATHNFEIQDYLNQYYNYNTSIKHSQGFRYSTAGNELAIVEFDSASYDMMTFPFNYTNMISNTISGQTSLNLQGNLYTDPSTSGTGIIEYDAYGTLMLPDTTFTNVARIHQRDSVHGTFTFPINDVSFVIDKYEFYDHANSDIPVFICSRVEVYSALLPIDPIVSAYSIVPLAPNTAGLNEDIAAEMNLEIYPNPANDNLTITFNALNGSDSQIELLDLSGKTVKVISNGFSNGLNKVKVDVSDIAEGIYMLAFTIDSKVVTKKVVIQ